MRPKELFLRCMADRSGNQYQAFCLDLDLAVQADSMAEAKLKLEAQISEYVYDALAGEDQAHAEQLLTRRAPPALWVRYYWYKILINVWHVRDGVLSFKERMPLVPQRQVIPC